MLSDKGVISWLAALIWVFIAKWTRQPLLCAIGSVLVCLAGTIALKVVPRTNVGGSLAAIYILETYWAPYMVFGQLIMYANVGGTSKKVAVFGISYLGYCVGKCACSGLLRRPSASSLLTRQATSLARRASKQASHPITRRHTRSCSLAIVLQ